MRGTVSGIRSLYGLFKVLKCNHQHGHFGHFVYIEYYSAGDIFTKFVKFYPLARFASSRCSELSAAFGDLRACYRGRVRITVALASAVISLRMASCTVFGIFHHLSLKYRGYDFYSGGWSTQFYPIYANADFEI